MMEYDIIFITTLIKRDAIEGLLRSFLFNNTVRLGVVIVAQNGIEIDVAPYESLYTKIWVKSILNQVNSSKARNLGIEYVMQEGISGRFVMFPDDDSSFDAQFFERFNTVTNPKYCYLTDVYQTGTKKYFQHIIVRPNRVIDKKYWNDVGAVNIILNFRKFSETGYFDENMGVAAKYGAGEDSDYFIRSLVKGAEYKYVDGVYSYHPSGVDRYNTMTTGQVIARFRNYARGVIYMLCKHKMYGEALVISFKALCGSILKFCTFDFKMSWVYVIAFYERLTFLIKIIFNRAKFYDHS